MCENKETTQFDDKCSIFPQDDPNKRIRGGGRGESRVDIKMCALAVRKKRKKKKEEEKQGKGIKPKFIRLK